MEPRKIAVTERATTEKVGAFTVQRALPTGNLKMIDPFLLIDHMSPTLVAPGGSMRIPPHPHAGFEVVTYLMDGEFFHRDSQGHNQVAQPGDLNWMTSGAGIVHSEGPTEQFLTKGGLVQLMQIWINLPRKEKQRPPSFRHYPSRSLPLFEREGIWLKVIVGQFHQLVSPAETHTPLFYYHLRVQSGHRLELPVDRSYNAGIYLMKGALELGSRPLSAGQIACFDSDGKGIDLKSREDAELIVFGGSPIKEKVVSYGPFVLGSVEEIHHAVADYESGKMGHLEY